MMNKMTSNIENKSVPFDMTESNMFFTQRLDEIESDIRHGNAWGHENNGQDYVQILDELYEMKSSKEKDAIKAYLNKEVVEA